MTLERAHELITANNCRYEQRHLTTLTIINETINMLMTLPLVVLPDVQEDTFVSTITTGQPPKGQRPITAAYQDFTQQWG